MALSELKEAAHLVGRFPVLWIPGIVTGLLAASLWVLYNLSGTFFTSRLLILAGLVLVFFFAGTYGVIKTCEGSARTLFTEGARYYFRVLLPQLVIGFSVMLVFVLVMITATFATGGTPDIVLLSLISIFITIPTLFLTFFYDTAAVLEDRKVFDSLKRSIELTATHTWKTLVFFIISAAICFVDFFVLSIIWEAALFDKIEPVSTYNETQIAAFTPDQLITMIGPDGMWITAVLLFIGIALILPLLLAFKVCFFKKLAGSTILIQQVTGEYDSKGRWYKY
jgi:hypothetical protein